MADVPPPFPGEFLRCVMGSTSLGLSLDGTSDMDLMGVALEPPEWHIRMGGPHDQWVFRSKPDGVPSDPDDVDLTVYTLRKWLGLAAKGNPTIINLMFVPPEYRQIDSVLADELRALMPFIASKEAGGRFLGYMKAQYERLVGTRGQKRTGQARQKYLAVTDEGFKWDTKYAMHICRLALQGIEFLETGRITMPIPEPHRSMLLAVRRGETTFDDWSEWALDLEGTLRAAQVGSSLPEHPNRVVLDQWLRDAYLREWEAPRPVRANLPLTVLRDTTTALPTPRDAPALA